MEHVGIPTEFFLKEAKQEYSSYKTRLITELLQNSLDAGATEIRLTLCETGYTCQDNGRGMTKDRMVSALLTMGGSDKLSGSTGGFGAAKKLLLFAHKSFSIHSINTAVEGTGLTYHFVDRPSLNGTKVIATFSNPDDWCHLADHARDFLSRCDFRGRCKVYVNGELFIGYSRTPYVKAIIGLGEVYAGKKDKSYDEVFVRHNGLFMFRRYVSGLNRLVIVEVKGNSVDMFTQSRESFRDVPDRLFDSLITELTIDKNSFIKPKPRKFVVTGVDAFIRFIANECKTIITPEMINVVASLKTMAASTQLTTAQLLETFKTKTAGMERAEDREVIEKVVAAAGTNLTTDFHFDLADSTWRKVKPQFIPNSGRPKYTALAQLWKVCIREVLKANGIDQDFVIGFTFSSTAEATHQKTNGVSCYLINPKSSTFDKGTKQEKVMSILTTAIHETVHSQGITYHDENFMLKFHELLVPTLTKGPTWRQLVKMAKRERV
jgi:Histidine kinase-, DNA gyrase B-, and HSP90-like ATPase